MTRIQFHLLLERYLKGESSPEEKAFIEQWYELLDSRQLFSFNQKQMSEIESSIWKNIQNSISAKETLPFYKKLKWQVVAAAVIIFVMVSIYGLNRWQHTFGKPENLAYEQLDPKAYIQKWNNADTILHLTSEDGSHIALYPHSSIKYPLHFSPNKREVYLNGNAFFDVHKNPSQPFYVYNKNVVTHVLGTKFFVKNNAKTNAIEVSVQSGRVEVYATNNRPKNSEETGVVITANQKAIYKEEHFQLTLVDAPKPLNINANNKQQKFVYDETPLENVLLSLSKEYGVEIVVENENLNNCPFTGDISEQNLYEQLGIICQALKASYEIKGTTILIRGKGCTV